MIKAVHAVQYYRRLIVGGSCLSQTHSLGQKVFAEQPLDDAEAALSQLLDMVMRDSGQLFQLGRNCSFHIEDCGGGYAVWYVDGWSVRARARAAAAPRAAIARARARYEY